MIVNTCPLHQFREFVAQRLHTAPFGWGSCGYELQARYNDLVQQYWDEGETVEDTAGAVHKLYMSRYRPKVEQMTRASLAASGCIFDDERSDGELAELDDLEALRDYVE
jgi:hypothetical protein